MAAYAGDDRPGASVLVLRGSEVVFRKSYGMADLEGGAAATPQTNYRLASVTKAFTAAAILRSGVNLQARIRELFPSLPAETDRITIEHLLTHSSGLIDYEDVMPEGLNEQLRDRDVLEILKSQRSLYFDPGASYRYSNSGYALLALIVEKVSKKSFAAFLRDEIFLPLGMKATVAFEEGVSSVVNRAYGYSRPSALGPRPSALGDSWQRTDQSLTSAVLGDGGIYSSIDDLTSWFAALDRGEFAVAMMPRVDTDVKGMRYGYGWRITADTIEHTGETIGFRNAVMRVPNDRLAIVILTNRNEGEPIALARAIRSTL